MARKFTARMVETLKAKKDRYEVWETGRLGFGVRVYPTSNKSWVYFYWFDSKKRRMTLGKFPGMTLAEAHEVHAKAEKDRVAGIDPGEVKASAKANDRAAPTLGEMIEDYLSHATKKTAWKDRQFFDKDVIPRFGKRKAQAITRRNIISILDSMVKRGSPIQANRGLAAIRRMFNWSISRDIVQMNPCTAIEPPGVEKSRDRVLSEGEIKSLWSGLSDAAMSKTVKLILKFQLVTLQRKGEVINMEWFEIDGNIWTIPARKAKNKLTHRVPLTDMAMEILEQVEGMSNKWVFPSIRGNKPLGGTAANVALKRNLTQLGLSDVTPHDLRRTGASYMASLGIPRLHISKILNHVERDITAVYDRYGYDVEKRHALEVWAAKLTEIITGETGGNVIRLRGDNA